jgi:hypothetical protein
VLTPGKGNKVISDYTKLHHICRAAHSIPHTWCREIKDWSGESYFRTGGRGLEYKCPQLGQSTNRPAIDHMGTKREVFL